MLIRNHYLILTSFKVDPWHLYRSVDNGLVCIGYAVTFELMENIEWLLSNQTEVSRVKTFTVRDLNERERKDRESESKLIDTIQTCK